MINNLLKNAKITRVNSGGAGSASSTPTKATIIDMKGFRSVMFVAEFGNVLITSAVSLKVAGADVNDTAQMALLVGSAGGVAGATDVDDKLIILDVVSPNQRYLEAQVFHVTADAPFDSVLAIQYDPINMPVTQGSTVYDSDTLANPAVA